MNEIVYVASLRLRHVGFINNERLQGLLMRSELAQQHKSNIKKSEGRGTILGWKQTKVPSGVKLQAHLCATDG